MYSIFYHYSRERKEAKTSDTALLYTVSELLTLLITKPSHILKLPEV
jgi:hypothetical protein